MARVDLRIPEVEFFRLTVRDFDVYYKRHIQALQGLSGLAGVVAAAVANFGFKSPQRWATPADFVNLKPSIRARKAKVTKDEDSVAELRAWMRGSSSA